MTVPKTSSRGNTVANTCVAVILLTASFIAGVISAGGNLGGFWTPHGENGTNTTTTPTTTTSPTTTSPTTTSPTTTTTTPQVDPPPDTTYNVFVRVYYTNAQTFTIDTDGTCVILVNGTADDIWIIRADIGESEMDGLSPVKRYTRFDLTEDKQLQIVVQDRSWNFIVNFTGNWVRTPSGIGDYLQTFSLDAGQSLECQVYLSPRWSE
jgi:hypothetical protein